jgi:hypothetical protein
MLKVGDAGRATSAPLNGKRGGQLAGSSARDLHLSRELGKASLHNFGLGV